MSERPNCIGYVYHELGIRKEEVYIHPPSLEEVLINFKIVDDLESADAVAVIVEDGIHDPFVVHIAKIEEDKWRISHRRRLGNLCYTRHCGLDLMDF